MNEIRMWYQNKATGIFVIPIWIMLGGFFVYFMWGLSASLPVVVCALICLGVMALWCWLGWIIVDTYFVSNLLFIIDENGIKTVDRKGEVRCSNLWSETFETEHMIEGSSRNSRDILKIKFEDGNTYKLPWRRGKIKKLSMIIDIENTIKEKRTKDFWTIVIVCVIVVVGALLFFFKNSDQKPSNEIENDDAAHIAYREILVNFLETYELPEQEGLKEEITNCTGYTDLSYNTFDVEDFDSDGIDELLININTATVAGMRGLIYDYNPITRAVELKFEGYPSMTFYRNGAVLVDAAHNQGPAGRFWPYTLYKYDAKTDSYKEVNAVDAYDKEIYEPNIENWNLEPYPDEIDKDGNGLVYLILERNSIGEITSELIVDDEEYHEWLDSVTEGTDKIKVEKHFVTKMGVDKVFPCK